MSRLFPERPPALLPPAATADSVDHLSELKRQYARTREYCGFTLDELINSRAAQRYLRELWLLGCMVRKPQKAAVLPPGNPFRLKSAQRVRAQHRWA